MRQLAKLISIFTILMLISGAVLAQSQSTKVKIAKNVTISTTQNNNVSSDANSGSSSNSADYSKPPLYLFVGNPTVASWCPDAADYRICDGEDFNDYTTLIVRVTDIKFNNWKDVPVTVTISDMQQTKKTNSNGEAIFFFNANGGRYDNILSISVEATSPKSGRTVIYTRLYVYDFYTPMDSL